MSTLAVAGALALFATSAHGYTKMAPLTPWHLQAWGPDPKAGTNYINIGQASKAQMVDVDLFNVDEKIIKSLASQGKTVICDFSAGTYEPGRPDADSFPEAALKKKYQAWGETWLDIRNQDLFKPIMDKRMNLAKSKGCDGVLADNLDCYSNDCIQGETNYTLINSQLSYARWLADSAHSKGLSIGLKNVVELIKELAPIFDWAMNEECEEFDECHYFKQFTDLGKAVFAVEYMQGASTCPDTARYKIARKYQQGKTNLKDCPLVDGGAKPDMMYDGKFEKLDKTTAGFFQHWNTPKEFKNLDFGVGKGRSGKAAQLDAHNGQGSAVQQYVWMWENPALLRVSAWTRLVDATDVTEFAIHTNMTYTDGTFNVNVAPIPQSGSWAEAGTTLSPAKRLQAVNVKFIFKAKSGYALIDDASVKKA
eukprot:comp19626_c0_seq1/m.23155 comp19626_c0_seq1/g.23155  ORF comp19626_c0_seq1/g.23155 comp19626_c0_seq1/m.23155 type:complete len:422 (-) comp19626_c0_seq1:304-1569(-)